MAALCSETWSPFDDSITPVLKGSCRIQGPVDEVEHDNQKNTVGILNV
uniref:Uncharacterized protein n=1 Tax=Nelumbo nucifera TaxID=4432 RepID=A0A822XF48_NELNU|nr:TPA_asm: hypothetical protein HUJ06_019746 [Nelumbo nucifera]